MTPQLTQFCTKFLYVVLYAVLVTIFKARFLKNTHPSFTTTVCKKHLKNIHSLKTNKHSLLENTQPSPQTLTCLKFYIKKLKLQKTSHLFMNFSNPNYSPSFACKNLYLSLRTLCKNQTFLTLEHSLTVDTPSNTLQIYH